MLAIQILAVDYFILHSTEKNKKGTSAAVCAKIVRSDFFHILNINRFPSIEQNIKFSKKNWGFIGNVGLFIFYYFKAYEKKIREWGKVGSPTNPLGERHFTPWSFLKSNRKNLLQRNGDRKRIVVVKLLSISYNSVHLTRSTFMCTFSVRFNWSLLVSLSRSTTLNGTWYPKTIVQYETKPVAFRYQIKQSNLTKWIGVV